MKFITAAALVSVIPAVMGLTVDSPSNVVVCEPQQFTWSGGVPPYYLSLIPGGQPSAPPIKQFPVQTGTSYSWLVDLQANTIFSIALKDNTGATAFSSIITIQPGGSTSCLNTNVTEGTTTSGGATATSGSMTGTSTGTASGSSASTTSTKPNGGARLTVSSALGVAGVVGLVGALLF